MTHAKSVESGSARDAGLEAALVPAENGCLARRAKNTKEHLRTFHVPNSLVVVNGLSRFPESGTKISYQKKK
jgi:hypothetical protein